jgi:hypothetical protein
MKILGRISLFLTTLVVALVISSNTVFAADPPVCGDYQPSTGCVCDAGRVEYQGYCFPSDISSCGVIAGSCRCGNANGTVDIVVDPSICGLGNGGSTGGGTGGTGSSVFGTVQAPPGVAQFNSQVTGTGERIGIIIFASNLIRIATIVAGIIVFMNFILAGYAYITSDGSAKVNEQVKNQLTYSVIGLVIIVASYTIIAIISLLLFGKADFILNPTITGPTP